MSAPTARFPVYLEATVVGGQLVLPQPLSLPDNARVRVMVVPAEESSEVIDALPLYIEFGEGVARYLRDPARLEAVVGLIGLLRRRTEAEFGVRIGPVHLRDNLPEIRDPGGWWVRMGEEVFYSWTAHLDRTLLLCSEASALPEIGIAAVEPVFGNPVRWITPAERAALVDDPRFSHFDPLLPVTIALEAMVRKYLAWLVRFEQLDELMHQLETSAPALHRAWSELGVGRPGLMRLLRNVVGSNRSIAPFDKVIEAAVDTYPRLGPADEAAWWAAVVERLPALEG